MKYYLFNTFVEKHDISVEMNYKLQDLNGTKIFYSVVVQRCVAVVVTFKQKAEQDRT